MKIEGYYICEDRSSCGPREIDDELQAYYDLLGCDLIQAVPVRVKGVHVCIICDEEAKCRGVIPAPTGVLVHKGEPFDTINGPCFVVGLDEDGEWCSLSSDEMKCVEGAFAGLSTGDRVLIAEV